MAVGIARILREPVPSDAESFVRERLRNRDHSFVETLSRAVFSRPDHPLAYGYPETTSVFREGSSAHVVRPVDEGRVVLQWGTRAPKKEDGDASPADAEGDRKEPSLVVSGGIKGGDELVGKPALLDLPVGQGRVVAFDFDPIHRYQTESDFRLVWNAILNWNDLPPAPAR
jgi:hypothetical protein